MSLADTSAALETLAPRAAHRVTLNKSRTLRLDKPFASASLLAVPRLLFLFLKLCFGPRTGHIDTRAHVVAPWQQALP